MKYLLIIFTLISFSASAQPTAAQLKADSIARAENLKFIQELEGKATIKELHEWAFNSIPAKVYSEFAQLYNEFLKAKLIEWRNKKK